MLATGLRGGSDGAVDSYLEAARNHARYQASVLHGFVTVSTPGLHLRCP